MGLAEPPTGARVPPPEPAGLVAEARNACGSEKAPFTRWPVAVADGSATDSAALAAVLITFADVLAS